MSQSFFPSAQPGILHHYSDRLATFEYSSTLPPGIDKPHSLLFIGGLSDGLFSVPFINDLAAALESSPWSVFFVLLSSSYSGWGVGSLGQDVEEIGQCVEYVRKYKAAQNPTRSESPKVVIMGHSTGSQDVLHYLYSPKPSTAESTGSGRPVVDGAILQSPVSDREHLIFEIKSGSSQGSPQILAKLFDELVSLAKNNVKAGNTETILPLSMTAKIGFSDTVPMNSRRFLSLTSPDSPDNPLEDDLFSSDLSDERLRQTFGKIGSRGLLRASLLVLPGDADQYVPDWVNKEQLLERWKVITKDGAGRDDIWDANSGLVPGATHSPSGPDQEEPKKELVSRVKIYLTNLEKAA
ncbi:hypothetical protein AJ80_02621 [Polytolypa hystricis UAMH7299]|uniref:Dolichol-phosphate mannosyltransferase n=1 Tax=Polytolypa hystricis (strain UAMH7299) TaxID=1447883 RepID=A0A2B7YR71_POLH7|nr:hypothetical protein AJ80_02621 [Polytolypa hystricis UAMH7299]